MHMPDGGRRDNSARVAVVGGGVIGLSVAWRLARTGHDVQLFERDRVGRGASWVAAGMLAPVAESGFVDEDFVAFARESLRRYPSFLSELENESGVRVPLDATGTLVVAFHRDDVESIRRLFEYRRSVGLPVEWLTGSRAREIEPLLSPRATAAMWIPDDHQVDNRSLVDALAAACRRRGVVVHEGKGVDAIEIEAGEVSGVRTRAGVTPTDFAVVAAGSWSGTIPGLPLDCASPVRPVKGQIVRLAGGASFPLSHVVRAPGAYVLAKGDGSVIVGATQEEMGFDTEPTAGPVKDLLERAWEAVPGIYDLPFRSVEVGLRPATRDHRPIIGRTRTEGLVMATGHFRHGILLAPATADAVCDGISKGRFGDEVSAFSPARFSTEKVGP